MQLVHWSGSWLGGQTVSVIPSFNQSYSFINPLTPEPVLTGSSKTHPQFPGPGVTGCGKAPEDNCLSYSL